MSSLLERLKTLDSERQRYILETLADHLNEAGQYDHLRALFDNDAWMHARFEGSGYIYDGYIKDLMPAWQENAHQQALQQIEAGEEPTAIAYCVRYALIRTTINSIATNYISGLITQAMGSGLWSASQAPERCG
ncbi:MAG: hypothetical protein HS126_40050 [Anaerolineales bacterium]|nr:hypothetical protein [Anaerolineales bacterium]